MMMMMKKKKKKEEEEEEEKDESVTKAWVTHARSEATFANYVYAIKVAQSFRMLAITLVKMFPPAAREPSHSSECGLLAIKTFGCVETKAIQDYIPNCLYFLTVDKKILHFPVFNKSIWFKFHIYDRML